MARFKIKIQYDGTNYFGWQMQSNKQTIQGELEIALAPLNNGKRVKVIGSGRTDTGVHALAQVAHFDLETKIKINQISNAMNARLPDDIRIIDVEKVSDEFHARFSAVRRYYRYQCYLGHNILFKNQSWLIGDLDKSKLDIFAKKIIGTYDFLSFSKLNKQLKNTECTIYQSEWLENNNNMLTFNICGNRFLHHMVRYLVGMMIAGSQGKITIDHFEELLKNPQKNVKIFKTPPEGLILFGIDYV